MIGKHSAENALPDFCAKPVLILGCGNLLFGDDGFGPVVIEYLRDHYDIPNDVHVMDAGTGVRKLLFTLALSPEHVRKVIFIDAIDKGSMPGEIFELSLEDMSPEKTDDLSLHDVPTSNLAKELREVGVEVRVFVCQVADVSKSVRLGLSNEVRDAVPRMCSLIAGKFLRRVHKSKS